METNIDKLMAPGDEAQSNERRKQELVKNAFNAYIIFIDLTNSTGIKFEKPFPEWVGVMQHFYEMAISEFKKRKLEPIKFLGDAVMYFYPDFKEEKTLAYWNNRIANENMKEIPEDLTAKDLIEILVETKNKWWDFYKSYLSFDISRKNFLSITIAIDYGPVIDFNFQLGGNSPDPLGEAVDRCFRISSVAGPNQILLSKSFFQQLKKCDQDSEKLVVPISISDQMLKGTKGENHLYYVIPKDEEIEWILDEKNKTLIEDSSKPFIHKVKLKLLRRKLDSFKGVQGGN